MDLKKVMLILVLFSFLLAVPSTIGAVKTFQVQENDLVTITPEALDPDNDDIIYTFFPPLDKNGRWQTGFDDAGEYRLKIAAFDGKQETTKEILLIVENKNQPPFLKENKATVKELQALDLKLFVADADDDPLEYDFTAPFDKNGLWSPGYDDQGSFVAKFSVKDGEFTVPMRIEVEVLNTNQPPKIKNSFSEEEIVSLRENETLSFYVEAEDGDNDVLSYSWILNPLPVSNENKAISNENKGEYFFNYGRAGEYKLVLVISDGQGHQVEKKWEVQVEDVNRKPGVEFSSIIVDEGELIALELPEKDADGDKLAYTFNEKFDGEGRWQTTYEDAGTYSLVYEVSDGTNKAEGVVEVTVLDVDRVPELRLPERLEVKEGETLSFVVEAFDPDGEDVDIFFENAPEGALYDSGTSKFTWTPGYDYIKRRDGMLSNILNALRLEYLLLREKKEILKVKACSQELCTSGSLAVVVHNINRPPVLEISSTATVTEGEILQLQPSSFDADGDIVRYYFTGPLHKRKGRWQTTHYDAGEYAVNITATDGASYQTLPVTVKVLQKNRPPTVAVKRDEYVLREGEEFVLPVEAFDPDNDSLSLYIENLPEGAFFRNNTLKWIPGYDFVYSEKQKDAIQKDKINTMFSEISFLEKESSKREHWISLVASDQEFDLNHPVKLIVQDVNQKPEMQDFAPAASVTLYPGQPFNFSVDVIDADEDDLTYTWNFKPGAEEIVGSNLVERTFVTPGEKKVIVAVSDGQYEVAQEWKVIIEEFPRAEKPSVLEEAKFKVYVIEH